MLFKETKVISTIEAYEQLPEGGKYQFIDEEIIEMPSPEIKHQKVVGKIFRFLSAYCESLQLGEVFISPLDVQLNPKNIFQPDVLFVSNENMGILQGKRIVGAPDLVIEVLSESTAYYDYKKKKTVYEAEGVKEYWIVDIESKTIEVYINSNEKQLLLFSVFSEEKPLKSAVFSDLLLNVSDIF